MVRKNKQYGIPSKFINPKKEWMKFHFVSSVSLKNCWGTSEGNALGIEGLKPKESDRKGK